jgi:hypothetical protein
VHLPQSGMSTVTTFVTTNIFFVEIFQYRWMYQKPNVLRVRSAPASVGGADGLT